MVDDACTVPRPVGYTGRSCRVTTATLTGAGIRAGGRAARAGSGADAQYQCPMAPAARITKLTSRTTRARRCLPQLTRVVSTGFPPGRLPFAVLLLRQLWAFSQR